MPLTLNNGEAAYSFVKTEERQMNGIEHTHTLTLPCADTTFPSGSGELGQLEGVCTLPLRMGMTVELWALPQ